MTTEKRDDGGHVFPAGPSRGITLRDWLAGKAIGGLVGRYGGIHVERMTEIAYAIADAAIERRKAAPGSGSAEATEAAAAEATAQQRSPVSEEDIDRLKDELAGAEAALLEQEEPSGDIV